MSTNTVPPLKRDIVYPESDGEPMADNTKQAQWIVLLYNNLLAIFHLRADVFVATNLFWYPVEGQPDLRVAPDVLVVFGRPKGHRSPYRQWEEDNVPLTVVFEILSPKNTPPEMADKHAFYEEHGVEEYYVFDPDTNHLQVYLRQGEVLRRIRPVQGFVSPRLGIRFDLSGPEMLVYGSDGKPFQTFEEVTLARKHAEEMVEQADQKANQAERRANHAEQRAARLAELSRKARKGQATPEELQELDRLEEQPPSGTP